MSIVKCRVIKTETRSCPPAHLTQRGCTKTEKSVEVCGVGSTEEAAERDLRKKIDDLCNTWHNVFSGLKCVK